MKHISRFHILVLLVMLNVTMSAQTLTSGYFLEGNVYRTQLNPAFQPEQNFFSFPLLGNLNLGVNSNVGLNDFIYPYQQDGYALTTFMSGTVDAKQFLNRIPQWVRIGEKLDMSIFSAGFKKWGGYNTISLSLHESINVGIPKSIFVFLKEGLSSVRYDFSGLNVGLQAYSALSLGHSRSIGDDLKVGATLHVLMGLGCADVKVDELCLQTNEAQWLVSSHAEGKVGLPVNAELNITDDELPDQIEIGSFAKPLGAGLDLGTEYNMDGLVKGLSLSAALTDLGLIGWHSTLNVSTKEAQFEFSGLDEIDPTSDNMDEQFDAIADEASELIKLSFTEGKRMTTALSPTFRLGAKYAMPFYDKLSAAMLFSHRMGKVYGYTEGRLFVNVAPTKGIELSANGALSTYGSSWGWMVNFHPKGFGLFFGSDCMLTKVTPQFIPVGNVNANVSLGINFPL